MIVDEAPPNRASRDPADWADPEAARMALADQLEAEGAQWSGILNAATAQLVGVIARAIESDAWVGYGIHTPSQWAGLKFGLAPQRAKRLVAAAERLAGLPTVSDAFTAGELTEDLVSVIVRANPGIADEALVTQFARITTVGQLRYALRGVPKAKPLAPEPAGEPAGDDPPCDDHDAPTPPAPPTPPNPPMPQPDRSRVTSWFNDDDRWQLRADLDPTEGSLVEKALRAAGDRLFNNRHGDNADPALRQQISTVDALVLLCRIGLDALDPATRDNPGRMPSERFLVNVHLDPARPDTGALHLGPVLPAHLREEATCDALRRLWLDDGCGNVNLGRTARVVNAKLRTVLEVRDGACRYPGCGRTRGLIAHHLVHWERGGLTDTPNLVLLCAEHHRALHRGHFHITGDADRHLEFTDPRGRNVGPAPPQSPRAPVQEAAVAAGMPTPQWQNRAGEPGQWDLVAWSDAYCPNPPTYRPPPDDLVWTDPWITSSWPG